MKNIIDNILTALMLLATVMVIFVAGDRLLSSGRQVGRPAEAESLPEDPVPIRSSATKGAASAKAVVIIYSDFQCPFCSRLALDVLPRIEERYVVTGQAMLVFRHLPLTAVHSQAANAATAAECAGEQGQFWPMHDRMFRAPAALGDLDLIAHAEALGLDVSTFNQCRREPSATVEADAAETARLGLNATPVVFIGQAEGDRMVRVRKRVTGLPSVETLAAAIDEIVK